MLRRLSAHSPRESGARRMCCSSWQILHLFSVSVAPGPGISRSCDKPKAGTNNSSRALRLNHHSHSVPAVPEIPERIPGRHRGLRVAGVVPGSGEERHIARALRLMLEGERAPSVLVTAAAQRGVAPALALRSEEHTSELQ